MPDVKWLPEAVADLERLFQFLKKNLQSARRAAGAIRNGADLLQSAPEIGRPMGDGTPRRELVVPFASAGYVLRYRIDDEGAVVIIRIWHSREDRRAR
jgi:toxin ParE1/3/4